MSSPHSSLLTSYSSLFTPNSELTERQQKMTTKGNKISSETEPTHSSLLTSHCLLITGGCGFIGVNFLDFMLKKGFTQFRILDNLSVGSIESLESMLSEHGKFTKKEENNRIFYTFSSLSNGSSLLTMPNEIHGNEERSEFHRGPNSSLENASSPITQFHPVKSESHLTAASVLSPQSSSGTEAPKTSVLSPQSSQTPKVEFVLGDIRNPKDCLKATEHVSAVVHLAAQSGVPTSVEDPMLDCEINIMGTLNMLEACCKNNVDKFVFASSGAPLGEVEPPIHEEKVPRPVSPYGASKLAGKAYCNAFYKTFGIKTVVLRFGNVYGPRSSHKSSVVAKFFKRALEGLPLEIYGDGKQTRDFIYTEDLCNAIYLSLKALGIDSQFHPVKSLPRETTDSFTGVKDHLTGASACPVESGNHSTGVHSPNHVAGHIFQIATFKETTVTEIAEKIKDLVEKGSEKKVHIFYGEKRLGDVNRNFSDISKATEMLGFTPEYNLESGLGGTWQFFKGQGAGTDSAWNER